MPNVMRGWVLMSAIYCALTSAVFAEDRVLKGDEIRTLLVGHTALGTWAGQAYRQLFWADGTTIYAAKGVRSSRGKWRVGETGEFESWWGGSTWDRYPIVKVEDQLFWIDQTGARFAFEMLPGEQLVWPD